MKYDYVFKNGDMVDFETMRVSVGDLFVKDGLIAAAPAAGASYEAVQTIDARGKYVLPGLIDEHVHVNYGGNDNAANADLICPPSGVTTAVDGGTAGWANFELFHQANVSRYVTRVKAYLHASSHGVIACSRREENHDPADFREDKLIAMFRKYPETIRGLKIRMSRGTLGDLRLEPLERAVGIAERIAAQLGRPCPIAMHYADLPDGLTVADLLGALRPGDVFTHVFQNHGETIFDGGMRIKSEVRKARERGVLFDCCNGRIHWSFANLRAAVAEGFLPDIVSSDVIRESSFVYPGFSLVHAMCTLLASGMDELAVLKAVTLNPAKALGLLDEAGTLEPGRPADIAVVQMAPNERVFFDRFGGTATPERAFFPLMTVRGGETVFRQLFF